MTLEECYSALEGDYQSAVSRLMNENLVRKFIFKFLDDKTFGGLCGAMECGNYGEAFRAAHTIKGVCQNLSFSKLLESSSDLTEALRKKELIDAEKAKKLFARAEADYDQTVSAIRAYKSENGL